MCGQRGQSTVEWTGLLLLVAVAFRRAVRGREVGLDCVGTRGVRRGDVARGVVARRNDDAEVDCRQRPWRGGVVGLAAGAGTWGGARVDLGLAGGGRGVRRPAFVGVGE